MPDRRPIPTNLPKAASLQVTTAETPTALRDNTISSGPPAERGPSMMPKCQPFSVKTTARRVAPPLPLPLRSGAASISGRTGRDHARFALLVAGISAIVAAAPFVWVNHLSGSLREAMSSGQVFEGRSVSGGSVASDPTDGLPLIKANTAPYKRAVPAGTDQP